MACSRTRSLIFFASPLIVALFFSGCFQSDVQKEESRILAEINRINEAGRARLRSEDVMGSSVRLNDLSKEFPDRRDEMNREAEAVKNEFLRQIYDDSKTIDLMNELFKLPLSDSYRECVELLIEIQEHSSDMARNMIEEMDTILDPSVLERVTLEERLAPIRRRKEASLQLSEELDRRLNSSGCRGPNAR